MKCIRFSKKFRGQEKCHSQRQCIENITVDSDTSSTEKYHEMGLKMKHGHFIKNRMERLLKRRRFGHDHHKNRSHHDMEHDSLKKHRMNHGHKMSHHMHHGMEYGYHMHHRMEHDHHMHHRMKRGHHERKHDHHMHRRMKFGLGKFHRKKYGHMKFHKMTRFEHHRMEHKLNHGMHHKMTKYGHSSAEHDEVNKHHQMDEGKEIYPGNVQKESKDVCKCPAECNLITKGEIRTYPSKSEAQVSKENDRFQICLNTSSYQPEEICVKIIEGKIDVSAIHECVDDDMYEFHEMYRTFTLPENVDPENVSSRLESDGKLIVEAPITSTSERELTNEREIPVVMQNDE